jgi:hypothetical protein
MPCHVEEWQPKTRQEPLDVPDIRSVQLHPFVGSLQIIEAHSATRALP